MFTLKRLNKTAYDEFVANNDKAHFLQSYSWGEFCKVKKHLTPYYLGLINDDNTIVAATLLLQKYLPLNYSYFYAPRGFIIDYNNEELVKEMTNKIIKFAKKKKGIFVKIDPNIIIKDYNYLNEEQKTTYDKDKVYNILKRVGFKHLEFAKASESIERYSYRIDLTQPLEEIEKHFSKVTKQQIAKSQKLETEVVIGTEKDIKELYQLIQLTKEKENSILYDEDYYETLYEIFNGSKNTKAILFLGKVHLTKTIKVLEKKLKKTIDQISIMPIDNLSKSAKIKLKELKEQKENIKKELEKYKNYKQEYGADITLNAHMIVTYKDKAWVLYTKDHNILNETYTSYNTYYNHIKYCKEKSITMYEQPGATDNELKFGGNYIEFIGEWDYIINKPMYFIFTKLVSTYKNKNM